MKLIIGLGNPGKEYEFNRHNVGFMFIQFLISNSQFQINDQNVKILKTDGVFMNESGKSVSDKVSFFKVDPKNLFVVHDDLDIPFGQFKIQLGTGPKVHNGLSSIEQSLGTKDFFRVRIGTDSRVWKPHFAEASRGKLGDSGKGFVLDDFSKEEIKILEEVFPKIWQELRKLT